MDGIHARGSLAGCVHDLAAVPARDDARIRHAGRHQRREHEHKQHTAEERHRRRQMRTAVDQMRCCMQTGVNSSGVGAANESHGKSKTQNSTNMPILSPTFSSVNLHNYYIFVRTLAACTDQRSRPVMRRPSQKKRLLPGCMVQPRALRGTNLQGRLIYLDILWWIWRRLHFYRRFPR